MTRKTYTATFSNGTTIKRETTAEFLCAYRVIIKRASTPAFEDMPARDARTDIEFGFAKRQDIAEKAIAASIRGNTWVRPGTEPTTFETEIVACIRTK